MQDCLAALVAPLTGYLQIGFSDVKNDASAARSTEQYAAIWKIALMSVVTVGAATHGFLNCLVWFLNNRPPFPDAVAVLLLAALYFFGICSGIVYQVNREIGRHLSMLFLIAQIPVLQSQIVTFKFWALGSYTVMFYWSSPTFEARGFLGSYWEFAWFTATPDGGFGINLLPCVVMSLFYRRGR